MKECFHFEEFFLSKKSGIENDKFSTARNEKEKIAV